MTAPNTKSEIERALRNDCAMSGDGYVDVGDAAYMVERWRAEWLRDAEPRLRPVSEKPQIGDLVAARLGLNGHWRIERGAAGLTADDDGWVLLERAKPKTLAEEARELVARRPKDNHPISTAPWKSDVVDFLRRIAEEKRDE